MIAASFDVISSAGDKQQAASPVGQQPAHNGLPGFAEILQAHTAVHAAKNEAASAQTSGIPTTAITKSPAGEKPIVAAEAAASAKTAALQTTSLPTDPSAKTPSQENTKSALETASTATAANPTIAVQSSESGDALKKSEEAATAKLPNADVSQSIGAEFKSKTTRASDMKKSAEESGTVKHQSRRESSTGEEVAGVAPSAIGQNTSQAIAVPVLPPVVQPKDSPAKTTDLEANSTDMTVDSSAVGGIRGQRKSLALATAAHGTANVSPKDAATAHASSLQSSASSSADVDNSAGLTSSVSVQAGDTSSVPQTSSALATSLVQGATTHAATPAGASHVAHCDDTSTGVQSTGGAEAPGATTQTGFSEPHLLAQSPNVLEVGVSTSTHGWLRVRTELTADGAVTAIVHAPTTVAQFSLSAHGAGIEHFLRNEQVRLDSLTVASTASTEDRQHTGSNSTASNTGQQNQQSSMNADTPANNRRPSDGDPRQQPSSSTATDGWADERSVSGILPQLTSSRDLSLAMSWKGISVLA